MSLICCLPPEDGCICNKDVVCGGIHVINSQCEPHARAGAIRCRIHEIGGRLVVTVSSSSSDADHSPSA